MSWNPIAARVLLDASPLVRFIRELDKISNFKMASGRELVLLEENKERVTVYVSQAPQYMPDVTVAGTYEATSDGEGRHSNLATITKTLGYRHKTYRLHVKSAEGLQRLLGWYRYS